MTEQRRGAARHRAHREAASRFRFATHRGQIAAFAALAALGFVLGAPTSVRSADEAAKTTAATAASAESPPATKPAEKASAKKADASKPIEIKRMPPPKRKVSADNPARFPADI
jgi:hypothetical protein